MAVATPHVQVIHCHCMRPVMLAFSFAGQQYFSGALMATHRAGTPYLRNRVSASFVFAVCAFTSSSCFCCKYNHSTLRSCCVLACSADVTSLDAHILKALTGLSGSHLGSMCKMA